MNDAREDQIKRLEEELKDQKEAVNAAFRARQTLEDKLKAVRDYPLLQALLDKFFKHSNSYSSPEGPEDYWWIYARVSGINRDDATITMDRFETDTEGKIDVEFERIGYHQMAGWEEIQADEFWSAWRAVQTKLNDTFTGE